jgi:hypothetical protein
MRRVQRLDRINGQKPANLIDSRSLTLKFRSAQIGRFFYHDRVLSSELGRKLREVNGLDPSRGEKKQGFVSPCPTFLGEPQKLLVAQPPTTELFRVWGPQKD